MAFLADDLGARLVALLGDAGRKRLTTVLLGSEQERALRRAATAAVKLTAGDLRSKGGERPEELAMVVSQMFKVPVPEVLTSGQATALEALPAGVTGQLILLDDPGLTGTGKPSADVPRVSGAALAIRPTGHMVREIVIGGVCGFPLEPSAVQLNHDARYLQGQQVEDILGRLDDKVQEHWLGWTLGMRRRS